MDCSPPGSSVHGFPRQKYWSGLPFPPPGDFSDPGIEPTSLALQADSFTTEPPGKPGNILSATELYAWRWLRVNFMVCEIDLSKWNIHFSREETHKANLVLALDKHLRKEALPQGRADPYKSRPPSAWIPARPPVPLLGCSFSVTRSGFKYARGTPSLHLLNRLGMDGLCSGGRCVSSIHTAPRTQSGWNGLIRSAGCGRTKWNLNEDNLSTSVPWHNDSHF